MRKRNCKVCTIEQQNIYTEQSLTPTQRAIYHIIANLLYVQLAVEKKRKLVHTFAALQLYTG